MEDSRLREELEREISILLDDLPKKNEKKIIQMRFGIGCDRTYTLKEVSVECGVTLERVRQIEAHALRWFRHPARTRDLRCYL